MRPISLALALSLLALGPATPARSATPATGTAGADWRAALAESPCFRLPHRPASLRAEPPQGGERPEGLAAYRRAEFHLAAPAGIEQRRLAQRHLEQALRAGELGAALELGALRYASDGDAQGAFEAWLFAASRGDARSMSCVATALLLGRGVAADPTEAVRWLVLRDERTRGRGVLGPSLREVAMHLPASMVNEGRSRARRGVEPMPEPPALLLPVRQEAPPPPAWLSGASLPPRPPAPPENAQVTVGTGFVAAPGGLVITAEHVVQGCAEIEVVAGLARLGGVRVLARHEGVDLALLAVPGLERAPLPVARQVRLGEEVVALGYPGRGIPSERPTATLGNVSAEGSGAAGWVIQYTAPTQPGKSGGPLLDRRGQVVGVVFAVRDTRRELLAGLVQSQNVNFAVAAGTLHAFLTDHGITPAARADGPVREIGDLVAQHERSVVQVNCHVARPAAAAARATRG